MYIYMYIYIYIYIYICSICIHVYIYIYINTTRRSGRPSTAPWRHPRVCPLISTTKAFIYVYIYIYIYMYIYIYINMYMYVYTNIYRPRTSPWRNPRWCPPTPPCSRHTGHIYDAEGPFQLELDPYMTPRISLPFVYTTPRIILLAMYTYIKCHGRSSPSSPQTLTTHTEHSPLIEVHT